ncbi:radical SAM protein [Desulfobacter postgatei]|uniref:B12-binding domain-containing radical SAM protein n=1 Tax=Desulfobacter postgatei TaxID=2293 RepID=UPI00259B7C12|nr:radical SAM protein [uncultured Desulfobacter sp.]
MRILLINGNRFKQPWPVIPFGLSCIAKACEDASHTIQMLDLCFSKNCAKDIRQAVHKFIPDIIGVSIRNIDNSVGYNTLFLLEETKTHIITPCKEIFTGPIVIGGPSVGISGAEMLDFFDLSYAIRGDGEVAFIKFLERYKQGQSLTDLEGLVIRKDGKIIQDSLPMRVKDLNDLGFVNPANYIDLDPYRKFDSPIQIQTKRGCALNCTYCTYNRIEGNKYRLKDPQSIADAIEILVKETGINHIEFTDSTFNIPLGHCKKILKALALKKLDLNLRTMGLNPGAVDEELVALMKTAGFRDVDLGAESGSDTTLKGLGKNFTKADVIRAGRLLQAKNIPVTWYLLVGAPGETAETLRETFETINQAASKWDLINIGVGVRVYKGAPMADQMIAENPMCTPDNFFKPVNFEPEAISLEKIKKLTKLEALNHPNYYMYDEDENTPSSVLAIGVFLLKLFSPKQPVWRLHILIRLLQKYTGILWLKKIIVVHKLKK